MVGEIGEFLITFAPYGMNFLVIQTRVSECDSARCSELFLSVNPLIRFEFDILTP